jgi:hypothetical protein
VWLNKTHSGEGQPWTNGLLLILLVGLEKHWLSAALHSLVICWELMVKAWERHGHFCGASLPRMHNNEHAISQQRIKSNACQNLLSELS